MTPAFGVLDQRLPCGCCSNKQEQALLCPCQC